MAFSTAKSAASGGRVLMCGASLEPVRFVLHDFGWAHSAFRLTIHKFKCICYSHQVYYKQLCRKCQVGFNPYRVESILCKVPLTCPFPRRVAAI